MATSSVPPPSRRWPRGSGWRHWAWSKSGLTLLSAQRGEGEHEPSPPEGGEGRVRGKPARGKPARKQPAGGLEEHGAAVHDQGLAGDEGAVRGGEEHGG